MLTGPRGPSTTSNTPSPTGLSPFRIERRFEAGGRCNVAAITAIRSAAWKIALPSIRLIKDRDPYCMLVSILVLFVFLNLGQSLMRAPV